VQAELDVAHHLVHVAERDARVAQCQVDRQVFATDRHFLPCERLSQLLQIDDA